ncbi:aspartyl protease family protein [Gammaproteobacteria bacterium]
MGLWIGEETPQQTVVLERECPLVPVVSSVTAPLPTPAPTTSKVLTQPKSAEVEGPTIEQWLELARQALVANNLEQAKVWIRHVLDIDAYDPEAALLQGEWLYRTGRCEEGLRLLVERRALERDATRLRLIDARLAEWLPGFVSGLTAEEGLNFLTFLIRNLPEQGRYFLELAELQLRMGKYQEANYTLTSILYDPIWGEKARELETRIDHQILWSGGQRLPMEIRGQQHIVIAQINGHTGLRLLVDTGASLTVLSKSAAQQAALTIPTTARRIRLQTASGVAEAQIAQVAIVLGNLPLAEREVAVLSSSIGPDIDGLLGMDILGTYEFLLDQDNKILLLQSKKVF